MYFFLYRTPQNQTIKHFFHSNLLNEVFFDDKSNALTQKLFFKYLRVVLIFETKNILICSVAPLELLYISLLFYWKRPLFYNYSIKLKEAAVLIIELIFLGSVISSKAKRLIFLLLLLIIKFLSEISSISSTSAYIPDDLFPLYHINYLVLLVLNITLNSLNN